MSIKPFKDSYYSLESIKSSKVSRHEIGSIFEPPRDVDVIQCFDSPVKTSCGYLNMAKKTETSH